MVETKIKIFFTIFILKRFTKMPPLYCKINGEDLCICHVTYGFQSESTLYSLPEYQGTPCSKQAPYLKFKRQQRDSNPQPLSS